MYRPLDFHFHAPSEHTFDGKHYDLEMHFVHVDYNKKKLAVIAVFFDQAAGGRKTNQFLASLQLDKQNLVVPSIPINELMQSLKKDNLYTY